MGTLALDRRDAHDLAERLRRQARTLTMRAVAMCREAEELKREAVDLATEADKLEREPVRVGRLSDSAEDERPRARVRDDLAADAMAGLEDRITAVLEFGGMTARQVADHLHIGPLRAKAALARLEADGRVYRTGATRSTRYHVPDPEPVRTGSATLHVFTRTTPARELEDRRVAYSTAAPAAAGALPEADTEP